MFGCFMDDHPPSSSVFSDLSKRSPFRPAHFVIVSSQCVLGNPLLHWLEVVPCIIFSSKQLPSFLSMCPKWESFLFLVSSNRRASILVISNTQSLYFLSLHKTHSSCLSATTSNAFIWSSSFIRPCDVVGKISILLQSKGFIWHRTGLTLTNKENRLVKQKLQVSNCRR